MLILTRNREQGVVLLDADGNKIARIVWLGEDWRTGQARIGFDAPESVTILRDELIERGQA